VCHSLSAWSFSAATALGWAMAQRVHRDAGDEVEIFVTALLDQVNALAAFKIEIGRL
jgi:hypothetical protein